MEPSIEKLRLYKTAWSPVFNCFVAILRVYTDENGAPILECRLHPSNNVILFRASELTDYVL